MNKSTTAPMYMWLLTFVLILSFANTVAEHQQKTVIAHVFEVAAYVLTAIAAIESVKPGSTVQLLNDFGPPQTDAGNKVCVWTTESWSNPQSDPELAGDLSGTWFVLAILSAMGLLVVDSMFATPLGQKAGTAAAFLPAVCALFSANSCFRHQHLEAIKWMLRGFVLVGGSIVAFIVVQGTELLVQHVQEFLGKCVS